MRCIIRTVLSCIVPEHLVEGKSNRPESHNTARCGGRNVDFRGRIAESTGLCGRCNPFDREIPGFGVHEMTSMVCESAILRYTDKSPLLFYHHHICGNSLAGFSCCVVSSGQKPLDFHQQSSALQSCSAWLSSAMSFPAMSVWSRRQSCCCCQWSCVWPSGLRIS